MNRARRTAIATAAFLAALAAASAARAEPPAAEATRPQTKRELPAPNAWVSVSDADLGKRGTGSAPTLALLDSELDSHVKGNYVGDYVTTGDVNISDRSLTGFKGIGQLTFNTGNNNSIQSNLLVIINLQ